MLKPAGFIVLFAMLAEIEGIGGETVIEEKVATCSVSSVDPNKTNRYFVSCKGSRPVWVSYPTPVEPSQAPKAGTTMICSRTHTKSAVLGLAGASQIERCSLPRGAAA